MKLTKYRPATIVTFNEWRKPIKKFKRVILTDGERFFAKGIKVQNPVMINDEAYAEVHAVSVVDEHWFTKSEIPEKPW